METRASNPGQTRDRGHKGAILDPQTDTPHNLDSQSVADAITLLDETIAGAVDPPTGTMVVLQADLTRLAELVEEHGTRSAQTPEGRTTGPPAA